MEPDTTPSFEELMAQLEEAEQQEAELAEEDGWVSVDVDPDQRLHPISAPSAAEDPDQRLRPASADEDRADSDGGDVVPSMSELLASLGDLDGSDGEDGPAEPDPASPVTPAQPEPEEKTADLELALGSVGEALPVVSASDSRIEGGSPSEAPGDADDDDDELPPIMEVLRRAIGTEAAGGMSSALVPLDKAEPRIVALLPGAPKAEHLIADAAQLSADQPAWSGPVDPFAERSLESVIELRHRARRDFLPTKNATLHRRPPKKVQGRIREGLSTLRHEQKPLLALTQNGEQPMAPQTMAAMLLAPPGTQDAWNRAEQAQKEDIYLLGTNQAGPPNRGTRPGESRSERRQAAKAEGNENSDSDAERAQPVGVNRPFRSAHSLQTYHTLLECCCDDWKIPGL